MRVPLTAAFVAPLLGFFSLLTIGEHQARAATEQEERNSLTNISDVDLAFTFLRLDKESEARIRTDVELSLRKGGLRPGDVQIDPSDGIMIPFPQKRNPPPILRVTAVGGPSLCDVTLVVTQSVWLKRDPKIGLGDVDTWHSYGPHRTGDDCSLLRSDLRDLLDRFLNDWLSVGQTSPRNGRSEPAKK